MDHTLSQLLMLHAAAMRLDGMDGLRQLQAGTAASAIAQPGRQSKDYWERVNKKFSIQAGIE